VSIPNYDRPIRHIAFTDNEEIAIKKVAIEKLEEEIREHEQWVKSGNR